MRLCVEFAVAHFNRNCDTVAETGLAGVTMDQQILSRVGVSGGRRAFGLGVLAFLALALLVLALGPSQGLLVSILVMIMALMVLAALWRMLRATALELILTPEGLSDSSGYLIAPMDQIEGVDRGTFAFKPSNGFVLRLSESKPYAFKPGLYWQVGRRVGVGGVLRAAETKQMADVIAIEIAQRHAPDEASGPSASGTSGAGDI